MVCLDDVNPLVRSSTAYTMSNVVKCCTLSNEMTNYLLTKSLGIYLSNYIFNYLFN
jgi:hypothetical protein